MDWMNQVGNLLQQYAGASADQAPPTAHEDFDQASRAAPPSALADGIAAAFRSDQTPPFAQMVAQLFRQSGSQERAGLLNMLLAAVGPALLSQFLSGRRSSPLAGLLGSGQTQITPQQADQVSPEEVQEVAEQAAQQNSSIMDRIGEFYAEHPTLVKTLGAAALTMVLSRMAQRR